MRVMEMAGNSETGNDARSAAALALKHICDAGVTRISPAFLQPLLVIYRRVLEGDATDTTEPAQSGAPPISLEKDDILTARFPCTLSSYCTSSSCSSSNDLANRVFSAFRDNVLMFLYSHRLSRPSAWQSAPRRMRVPLLRG